MKTSIGWLFVVAGTTIAFAQPATEAPPATPAAADVARVRALLTDGKNDDAEKTARAALAMAEAAHGPDGAAVAPVLEVLVEAMIGNGHPTGDEALAHVARAQAIRDATTPAGDASRALALDVAVKLRVDRGEYEMALAPAQQALALREAAGADAVARAKSYAGLGLVQFYRQDFHAAKAADERALALYREALGAEHPDTLNAMNSLATDLMRIDDIPAARSLIEQLIVAYTRIFGPEHVKTGAAYTNLAIIAKDMGELARARPLFARAIAIKEKALGANHRRLAIDLQNLAVVERDLGNFAAVEPLLQRCLALLTAAYGEEHPDIANIHADLAITARTRKDFPRALAHAERAVAIDRALGDIESPDYGADLATLATIHQVMGRHDLAIPLYLQALAVMEPRMGADHSFVLTVLLNLANSYIAVGDLAHAAPLVDRYTTIARDKLVPMDPWYLDTVVGRAEFLAANGRHDEALAGSRDATRIAREQILFNLRTMPEADALRFLASRPAGIVIAQRLSPQAIDANAAALWDAALPSRGVVLDELLARQADARASPAVARARDAWRAANETYAHRLVAGYRDSETRDALDAARAEVERREAAFATASASFAGARRRAAIRLGEVAAALPDDTALVAYWRLDATSGVERDGGKSRRFGAFVLAGRDAAPRFVELTDDLAAQALARDWRARVIAAPRDAAARRAAHEAGIAVRRALWDPLVPLVGDARRVLMVADGAALQVSFAALPVGDGYLVDRGPAIHVIDDERDVLPSPTRRRGGLLALGGADFDSGASTPTAAATSLRSGACRALGRAQFTPLPQSAIEADAIAALWKRRDDGDVVLLKGDAATESAFKRAAAGQRVLHLATHGITSDTCVDAPPGTRAISGELVSAAPTAPAPALALYGLAFAGANARGTATGADDGVLTAEELAALDLRAAEWVVLSSCDSGNGSVAEDDGLVGLRRAVRVAGAGASIMSLWPVDDAATRAWMEALYHARFDAGRDTADAVWQAHRTILAARRAQGEDTSPFYWGAFVASGDWR